MIAQLALFVCIWLSLAVFGTSALRVLLTGAGIGLRGVARCGLCSTPTPHQRPARCPSCNVPTDRASIITPLDLARRVSWIGSICASIFLVIVAFTFPVSMIAMVISRNPFFGQTASSSLPLLVQYTLATATFVVCIVLNVRRFQLLYGHAT